MYTWFTDFISHVMWVLVDIGRYNLYTGVYWDEDDDFEPNICNPQDAT